MPIHQIPAAVLRALLLNVDGEISSASPYAFLLDAGEEGQIEPHLEWLKENDLLDSPPEQDGKVAIRPSVRLALDILARPVRRILISELSHRGISRAMYVSDGAQVVVAMFDDENAIVSDPLDLETFRDSVVESIGTLKEGADGPDPVQLPPSVLGFLGAVVGPWWAEGDASADGADQEAPEYPELSWPIERKEARSRLADLTGEAEFAGEILDSLVDDRILKSSDGRLHVHPDFEPWHRALSSGDFLEIRRLEFPDSDLFRTQAPVRAYFAGPQGGRILLWPAESPSGEVLLSRPSVEELRRIVGYLIGYVELEVDPLKSA